MAVRLSRSRSTSADAPTSNVEALATLAVVISLLQPMLPVTDLPPKATHSHLPLSSFLFLSLPVPSLTIPDLSLLRPHVRSLITL